MKNPWATFAGICSLVIGIVIFSVIFGGYSSFQRSQNRIEAAKNLLVEQCRNQLSQIKKLSALPGAAQKDLMELLDAAKKSAGIVDRLETLESPIDREVLLSYEAAQVAINEKVAAFIQHFPSSATGHAKALEMEKKLKELETAVFMSGRRYNKEARYFNTRTRVFPGVIVAKIFGLDSLYFNEIPMDSLKAVHEKGAQSAS